MFDDLLGKSDEMQKQLASKLSTILIEEKMEGITINANAAREILSIDIDASILHPDHKEQLEDQLIVIFNRVLGKISQKEQEESASFMKELLPPGFDNLFG
jgi:DNA-binding protein YbaB